MSNYIGSEWRKWDLHIHTPSSIVHDYKVSNDIDIWEEFINKLEELPKEIKVIGINDYLFLDGYEKILEYKKKERLKNIDLILPVIEFRLKEFVGNSKLGRINYHIIFSDKVSIETINQQFLSQLYGNAKLVEGASSSTWNGALSRQSIRDLGKHIKETTPAGTNAPNGSDLEVGFNNINFELSKIESLLENGYINGQYLKAIGKTEWNDFRWDGSVSDKKTLINGCDFVFIASKDIEQAHKSKEKLREAEVNSKVMHCSDAHEFYSDTFKPKILGHCLTWIKADTTFEGLKQVIYEPESRLCLSTNKPQTPLHKIKQVTYNFDENTQWDNDKFCLTNLKDPITFSPSFTCIIGGRGSGKSTLLNAIAEKIGKGNNFFSKLSNKDVSSKVIIEPEFVENIEYLAQNTIEEFATNDTKFTEAIFDRLNKSSSNKLKVLEDKIFTDLKIFDDRVLLLQKREQLHISYIEAKKELKKYQSIIDTFADETFIKNKNKLQVLQKKKVFVEASRKKYESLFIKIQEISDTFQKIDEPKNNYDTYFNSLYKEIDTIFETYKSKDYSSDKNELAKLNDEIKKCQEDIETFLREKGLDDENIKDAQTASGDIEETSFKINALKKEILNIRKVKIKFTENEIDSNISLFKKQIETELSNINTKFLKIANQNPEDVKNIKITYSLNNNVFDVVFNEFSNKINITSQISSFRKTFMDYLQDVSLEKVLEFKNSKEFILKIPIRNSLAYSFLTEVFLNKTNFLIYQIIIKKYLRDIKNNKILTVHYNDNTLVNSSFGQRCTAAIVILISLGNTPIIIDEPEAHLDSSLIANYLVELIKDKKQHRQIIFATHNANFVLNADAELIIKLENNNGDTTSTSFSIENLNYREELLKLEGGKEAFKKREQKYNI